MSESDKFRRYAAILGLGGVVCGAFGAHILRATLEKRNTRDSWRTAVKYQLVHAMGLLIISTREIDKKSTVPWNFVANCWFAGTLFFSGSVYSLSLGGPRMFGLVTPLGGVILLAGWGALFAGNE